MNLSGITGLFSGLNWQAIALKAAVVVIVLGAAFGVGYHYGEGSVVKPLVTATVNATATGAKVQGDKTAKDAKANQADSKGRQDANTKRDNAVAAIKKSEPALLPAPVAIQQCPPVSAEAMDKLNDPDIIGRDAQ
jgi:hypothetical protein